MLLFFLLLLDFRLCLLVLGQETRALEDKEFAAVTHILELDLLFAEAIFLSVEVDLSTELALQVEDQETTGVIHQDVLFTNEGHEVVVILTALRE